MQILITIDLSQADLPAFDHYEAQVLPLLALYGGAIIFRLRATDDRSEFHLLQFPDADAFAAYKADPRRTALASLWQASGATATTTPVTRLGSGPIKLLALRSMQGSMK